MLFDPNIPAIAAVRRLQAAGHTAYLAGGCVRDALLKRTAKDYDIATSAHPEAIKAVYPKAVMAGAHFGVCIIKELGESIETATFRTDGCYGDGRRPDSVCFSTAEEDAQRRDFTVNGLFYDPERDEVIDYVGGLADLQTRTIRAIGDAGARFQEDRLRLMRAVRFAVTAGFVIEPVTWDALLAETPFLPQISIERIREEFTKILLHPQRARGLLLLDEAGLLAHILPEMEALKGCEQPPQYHPEGDVWVHTLLMLSLLPEACSVPLVLSVLLHDIAKPATRVWDEAAGRARFNGHDKLGAEMAETILRRLKYPNQTTEATAEAVACHMKFMHVTEMRPARLKLFMARPHFDDELALHRVDCLGSHGDLANYDFLKAKQAEYAQAPMIPPRLLTGHDIMQLGHAPGPRLREILEAIQVAQLENELSTREEALAWVQINHPVT